MYLTILTTTYGIDSIEFTGNILEALVYDAASDRSESVAIPICTKQELDILMQQEGRPIEQLEDFLAYDYFVLLNEEIRAAIQLHFPGLVKKAKRAVYGLLIFFLAAHILTGVIWAYVSPYGAVVFYFISMMLCLKYCHKNNLIN